MILHPFLRYRVDRVFYNEDLVKVLSEGTPTLLLLNGVNSDSRKPTRQAAFDGISQFKTNDAVLFPVMTECRVTKTEKEIEVMRYVTKVSSDAHKMVIPHYR